MAEANPYLNARREWDERYGDALSRAKNWRLAAFASLAIASVAVLGITYIGAQSKIKPFVVAIDKMGNPIAMAQPVTGGAINQRIVEAQVANWLWNARTVLSDPAAQKVLIGRVYDMLGSDAAGYLNQYYSAHPPFGYVANVTITSVLPISRDTYQINWDETTVQNGQPQPAQHWKANITTAQDVKLAENPQIMLDNPLGLFIKNITWTPVVSGVASN
jgi:type IV secretion system protein VirB5